MTSFKNRFMSINSRQHSKLKHQLDRLNRQATREIKARIKMAKNELTLCDYSRILSTAKNALVVYSTSIINGASRGTESVSTTDRSLSKQRAAYAQNEKKNRQSAFQKEEAEFSNFINGLLRRVDKCSENHRKAGANDELFLDVLCNTK